MGSKYREKINKLHTYLHIAFAFFVVIVRKAKINDSFARATIVSMFETIDAHSMKMSQSFKISFEITHCKKHRKIRLIDSIDIFNAVGGKYQFEHHSPITILPFILFDFSYHVRIVCPFE